MSTVESGGERRSGVREWLRYDESLEPQIDEAFKEFIATSNIIKLFLVGLLAAFLVAPILRSVLHLSLEVYGAVFASFLYVPVLCGLFRVPEDVWQIVMFGATDPVRTVLCSVGLAILAYVVELSIGAVLVLVHLAGHMQTILAFGVLNAIVSGLFFAPLVEEAVFQGWLQTSLQRTYGERAVPFTTVAFLAYHVPRTLASCVRGVGLYTNAVLRRETRSLGAPIIAHVVNNFLAVFVAIYLQTKLGPLRW